LWHCGIFIESNIAEKTLSEKEKTGLEFMLTARALLNVLDL